MAKLFIKTKLNSVVVVGEFCGWNVDNALRVEIEPKKKFICVEDMPKCEYRVLSCRDFTGGEIYPTDGRQMANRYFSGTEDEKIICHF